MSLKLLSFVWVLLLFSNVIGAAEVRSVQVSATAQVHVKPDFARIQVQIDQKSKTSQAAKQLSDQSADKVVRIAKAFTDKKHIQTANFQISPDYHWDKGKQIFLGYRVNRQISIKLYRLDDYAELLEKLSGLNLGRVSFAGGGFDNIETYQNKALVKAIEKAKRKASLMASTLGAQIGEVLQVSEGGGSLSPYPQPAHRMEMKMADSASAQSHLEIKKQPVSASVSARFLLQ